MEKDIRGILDCFDEDGYVDFDDFLKLVNIRSRGTLRRRREREEGEEDRPKAKKTRERYAKDDPKSSTWYKYYVSRTVTGKRSLKAFRRRFRLPFKAYQQLVRDAREGAWFPNTERKDACGIPGTPLELLVLGALRYLGRGWTFDDIAEATGVSEEVHRTFFVNFVKVCFPLYVHYFVASHRVSIVAVSGGFYHSLRQVGRHPSHRSRGCVICT